MGQVKYNNWLPFGRLGIAAGRGATEDRVRAAVCFELLVYANRLIGVLVTADEAETAGDVFWSGTLDHPA